MANAFGGNVRYGWQIAEPLQQLELGENQHAGWPLPELAEHEPDLGADQDPVLSPAEPKTGSWSHPNIEAQPILSVLIGGS